MPDLQISDHTDTRKNQLDSLEQVMSVSLQVVNRWLASQSKPKSRVPNLRAIKDHTMIVKHMFQMRALLDVLQNRPIDPRLLNHPLLIASPDSKQPAESSDTTESASTESQPAAASASAAPAAPAASEFPPGLTLDEQFRYAAHNALRVAAKISELPQARPPRIVKQRR